MLPGGLGATWVWWGTAIVVVLAVARYAVASRRVGRRPGPVAILVVVAVPIAGVALSRTNSPWQGLVLLLVPVFFAWAWFHRDRAQLEEGPRVFAIEIWAQLINPPSPFGIPARGRVRLLIGEGRITTKSLKWPSWSGDFGMLNHTFRAADCEVDRPLMGVSSFLASHGKPSIVIRGPDSRHEVELASRDRARVESLSKTSNES